VAYLVLRIFQALLHFALPAAPLAPPRLEHVVKSEIGDYVKQDNLERGFQEYCRNLKEK
jgi:hypothetical protein